MFKLPLATMLAASLHRIDVVTTEYKTLNENKKACQVSKDHIMDFNVNSIVYSFPKIWILKNHHVLN